MLAPFELGFDNATSIVEHLNVDGLPFLYN